jgi:hypothetical protein
MIYKTTTVAFALGCIFLGTRMSVVERDAELVRDSLSVQLSAATELIDKNKKLNEMNNFLLEDNSRLIVQVNELKFTNEKKPTIIYKRYEKTTPINDNASEFYNDILTKRYGNFE